MTVQPAPPIPGVHPYLAAVRAALAVPDRAARLAVLERVSVSGTEVERRAAATQIGVLLDEAFDAADAACRKAGRPVPTRGGCREAMESSGG